MSLLDSIHHPRELKSLSKRELDQLAQEIRDFLVGSLSSTGGHLAPNLGVVELTIALHKVFSTPRDKIVWDVGHQAYVHKILTGRKKYFHTLRKFEGLSGFPKPEESEHDAFATGHSSTSISSALGMAHARDLMQDNEYVVAVIGDGALTGGMAFEALNNAGHNRTNITIILNDNEMSINENVGGLPSYLNRIRTDPKYHRVKEDIEYLLQKLPAIGGRMWKSMERVKDSIKYFMVSGMIFEELGISYYGPVDGHDISQLVEVMDRTKNIQGPVLIHAITQKGKGYHPSEKSPDKYHGTGAFNVKTGKTSSKPGTPPKYSQVFGDTLTELACQDENIVAVTAAMKSGTGLDGFASKFPRRFFDVGIAEQHAVTFSAGLAKKGLKPVVAIYSTFLQRAYDQLIHDVCLQNLPVVFALDRSGIVGGDGETHQGLFDLSYLRTIPNLNVMAPRNEAELQRMIKTAVNIHRPTAIRYPRGKGEGVALNDDPETIPLFKGEMIQWKKKAKIALIAVGTMVSHALKIAEKLESQGLPCTVFDARFIKPLDEENLQKLAENHDYLYTFEENIETGGFGSAVLEVLSRMNSAHKLVERFAVPDCFVPQGEREEILPCYDLDQKNIISRITGHFQGDKLEHG